MAKQKKKSVVNETGQFPLYWIRKMVDLYIFMLLAIYPLYYQNKYYNMGDAKWAYFSNVTKVALIVIGTLYVWYTFCLVWKSELFCFWKEWFSKLLITDYFVLGYLLVCTISTIITPYRANVIWGYDGWYMGFMAQLCFVMIYLFVSRYWRWDAPLIIVYLSSAMLVFFFGIIMRFKIDPMEMYVGLKEIYVVNFLSTLGQATWYSSYVCLIFPLGMFGFWYYDKKWQRIFFGIFTAMGFMTIVTQNSDSAYISFATMIFMLFWISLETNKRFERFLEVMIICFSSFKIMGICQIVFKDRATKLDTLSIFMSQSALTWILLIICIALYVLFKKYYEQIDVSRFKVIRGVALVGILAVAFIMIVYIVLNTKGILPDGLKSDNNYLRFDEFWGNNRGSSWMCAMGTFIQGNIIRKLVGAGPDCFYEFVYTFYKDVLVAKWGESTKLTCAHNEWLNTLVNLGLLGLVAYLGIFVSTIKQCFKNAEDYPELYAIAISVASYMGHNFFCYQQIICTPTVFILMGAAGAIIRRGYYREVN